MHLSGKLYGITAVAMKVCLPLCLFLLGKREILLQSEAKAHRSLFDLVGGTLARKLSHMLILILRPPQKPARCDASIFV